MTSLSVSVDNGEIGQTSLKRCMESLRAGERALENSGKSIGELVKESSRASDRELES